MIESFVDLTYRGLPLGRRIKLTQVRPTSGYLEMPASMPVGTTLALATDEGVTIECVVAEVKEQVAGAEIAPGMKIIPALGGETASWWHARVALPELEPEPSVEEPPDHVDHASRPMTVRPRNATVPTDPPAEALQTPAHGDMAAALKTIVESAAAAPPQVDTKRTTVMAAIDQELLAQLTKDTNIELFSGGEHAIVDDGNRTTVMTAIDPAAMGLEDSGPTQTPDGDDPEGDKPKSPRKRRTKKKP